MLSLDLDMTCEALAWSTDYRATLAFKLAQDQSPGKNSLGGWHYSIRIAFRAPIRLQRIFNGQACSRIDHPEIIAGVGCGQVRSSGVTSVTDR
jgi:hypothetical protein